MQSVKSTNVKQRLGFPKSVPPLLLFSNPSFDKPGTFFFTPCSPSSETNRFLASQEIPLILWFITAVTSVRHLSLSCADRIQSISPYTSWKSILILSSHLRLGLPSGSLSFRFPHQNPVYASPSPTRTTCPAHLDITGTPLRFWMSNNYRIRSLHSHYTINIHVYHCRWISLRETCFAHKTSDFFAARISQCRCRCTSTYLHHSSTWPTLVTRYP